MAPLAPPLVVLEPRLVFAHPPLDPDILEEMPAIAEREGEELQHQVTLARLGPQRRVGEGGVAHHRRAKPAIVARIGLRHIPRAGHRPGRQIGILQLDAVREIVIPEIHPHLRRGRGADHRPHRETPHMPVILGPPDVEPGKNHHLPCRLWRKLKPTGPGALRPCTA